MLEATPPLPNTPSWRGAQFKKAWWQLYLYFHWFITYCSHMDLTSLQDPVVPSSEVRVDAMLI